MDIRQELYGLREDRRERRRAFLARLSIIPTAFLATLIGAVAVVGLQQTPAGAFFERLQLPSLAAPAVERHFAACAGLSRTTCVVDGDTFWLDGTKIRIADINTPEIGAPQCASEAALGRAATTRLTELLSAGPFTLEGTDRDEDRYGRKLRVVLRDGISIGDTLIAEGLAERWHGRRGNWC